MEFFTLFVALFLIIAIWYYINHHERYSLALKLPGPPALPLIGNALLFLGKSPSELLKTLEGLSKEYGHTVRILIGNRLLLL